LTLLEFIRIISKRQAAPVKKKDFRLNKIK